MFSLSGLLTLVEIVFGLGMVIFVHELGHFLVAKWCNVKIDAFSIGFGPRMFGFRRGETEYKVCWLPLGGYVKMAGEIPGEGDPADPRNFANKAIWQRAAIFSAGVAMNILFGLVVFIIAFQIGVRFQEPRVGSVDPGEAAWRAGVQEGDLIVAVDGKEVASFGDILTLIAVSDADEGVVLTIDRGGERIDIPLQPEYDERVGFQRIGINPAASDEIGVRMGSPAAAAGLEDGDVLVSVQGQPVPSFEDFQEILYEDPLPDAYLVVVRRDGQEMTFEVESEVEEVPKIGIGRGSLTIDELAPGGAAARAGLAPGDRLVRIDEDAMPSLTRLRLDARKDRRLGKTAARRLVFRRDGQDLPPLEVDPAGAVALVESLSMREPDDGVGVGQVLEGFPAATVLRPGDVITRADGHRVDEWLAFVEIVEANQGQPLELTWRRDGQEMTGTIEPRPTRTLKGAPGFSLRPRITEPVRYDLATSCEVGWRHSVASFSMVLRTLKGILTGGVSGRNLGGPVAIAQMSYVFSQLGFGRFILFLGLLSINLAIINLLPIPILDGAHLVLLAIEKIKGKPLSENAQIKINYVGLAIIVALMLFVFTNDILRLISQYTT